MSKKYRIHKINFPDWVLYEGEHLCNGNLQHADFRGIDLAGTNLRGVNLRYANFEDVNMQNCQMSRAVLTGANLKNANLEGARLPSFQLCPEEGSFMAWKKVLGGVIKIEIPSDSPRTSCLVSRGCRAEFVKVIGGEGVGSMSSDPRFGRLTYPLNKIVRADKYDDDVRLEETYGVHFYMTQQEAKNHQGVSQYIKVKGSKKYVHASELFTLSDGTKI